MILAGLLLALALPAFADGLFAVPAFGGGGPPRIVPVTGGCPDLCCSYGTWKAKRRVKLYAEPGSSRAEGSVKEGEDVTAGDSVMYVRPRKVKVTMESLYGDSAMPKGSTLYLIRRLVDGSWRVWYKGAFVDGVSEIWDPAESVKVKGAWWVRVQTADGVSGWTKDESSFEGSRQTSCQNGG